MSNMFFTQSIFSFVIQKDHSYELPAVLLRYDGLTDLYGNYSFVLCSFVANCKVMAHV